MLLLILDCSPVVVSGWETLIILDPLCIRHLQVSRSAEVGCNVDLAKSEGMHPLHLAGKHGHTEVTRCLCLAGASINAKNKEGVAAEICARVQGHSDLGDLPQMLMT